MTKPSEMKPQAIAVIKFFPDGSLDVSLSSAAGVTARRIDAITGILYKKLQQLRVVERRKDAERLAKLTEKDNA